MSEPNADIMAARERLRARMGDVRVGGKGTARRVQRVAHKPVNADDKKLQMNFKRMGMNPIPGMDEVNMFQDDGKVLHFENPKVQTIIQANTFVVSGNGQQKSMQELLPGIITQLGLNNMDALRKIAENIGSEEGAPKDDDVPDLVGENFEEVSKS